MSSGLWELIPKTPKRRTSSVVNKLMSIFLVDMWKICIGYNKQLFSFVRCASLKFHEIYLHQTSSWVWLWTKWEWQGQWQRFPINWNIMILYNSKIHIYNHIGDVCQRFILKVSNNSLKARLGFSCLQNTAGNHEDFYFMINGIKDLVSLINSESTCLKQWCFLFFNYFSWRSILPLNGQQVKFTKCI